MTFPPIHNLFKDVKVQKVCPMYHASGIAKFWNVYLNSGELTKRFRVPDNLLIITVDNRGSSFVEKQFAHYGCKDLVALKPDIAPWSNTERLKPYLEYLKSDKAKSKDYVIFCDSDDVLFSKSPDWILHSFISNFDCDLLYNSTPFWIGYEKTSKLSVENNNKVKKIHPGKYLNAGLYIGRKDFIIEVYEDVLKYISKNDPPAKKYYYNSHLEIYRKNFPKGTGSDQVILRHLEFKYYPRLQLDTKYKLLRRY